MTANELADLLMDFDNGQVYNHATEIANMLRQQQVEIEAQKADATKWFLKYQECFVHGIKEAK